MTLVGVYSSFCSGYQTCVVRSKSHMDWGPGHLQSTCGVPTWNLSSIYTMNLLIQHGTTPLYSSHGWVLLPHSMPTLSTKLPIGLIMTTCIIMQTFGGPTMEVLNPWRLPLYRGQSRRHCGK